MKKVICIFVMILLISPLVSAVSFNNDTTFSQDDIDWVFVSNLSINSFKFSKHTMLINDDLKFNFIPESKIIVTLYNVSSSGGVIGVKSLVTQTVDYKISSKLQSYMLSIDNQIFLEKIEVNDVEKIYNFLLSEQEQNIIVRQSKVSWFKKNSLVVIIPKTDNFFDEKIILINNFILISSIVALFLFILIFFRFVKKMRSYNVAKS